ncbi:MAG: class I adenylate-forming enzyme family protein [Opitutaceae bacterium]
MQERLDFQWAALAHRDPDAVAVVEAATGAVTTRQQLSEAAAAWRIGVGSVVRRGDRVVLAGPNSVRWLEVFLALLEAGAVPAALDPGEPEDNQIAMAGAVGARWLWTPDGLRELPGRRRRPWPDECLIKLTSGTTGRPRAHRFTHAQMIADGRQICRTMGIAPADRNLALIPLGHSYGLGNLIVPLFDQGTPLVIASSALPHVLAADIERHRPTVFPTVPVILRALTRADVAESSLRSLRLVISAGAVLEADVAAAFHDKFGRMVHGFYGSSETGGMCYDRTGEASLLGRSVGAPLEGVRLTFRRGGRFWIESAAVRSPGRHSPADRGELNTLGELVLRSRAGRTIKLAGRRVELGEIEAALRRLEGVSDAFAVPHPQKPDALAAAVVGELSAVELRRMLRAALAPWKIPERLLVLPEFPTTARGKVDQRRLRALLEAES